MRLIAIDHLTALVQMHLLFKQRRAGPENDNRVGLKPAKHTY